MANDLDTLRSEVMAMKQSAVTGQPKIGVSQTVWLLDVSSSMSDKIYKQPGHKSKIDSAKEALMKHAKYDETIITFGSHVHVHSYQEIERLSTNGMTAMLPAIMIAVNAGCLTINMITDGDPNQDGNKEDVLAAVAGLTGIRINTIGVGDDCDLEFLRKIANMTGGRFQHCDNVELLDGQVKMLAAPIIALP